MWYWKKASPSRKEGEIEDGDNDGDGEQDDGEQDRDLGAGVHWGVVLGDCVLIGQSRVKRRS